MWQCLECSYNMPSLVDIGQGPRLFLFSYAAFIVPLAFLMSFGQVQRVEVLLYSSHAERRCRNVSFVRIYYTSARHLLHTVCGLQ